MVAIHVGHKFYWILPLVSGLVWLGTILGLFLHWRLDDYRIYASQELGQTIAFISDVGAQNLKPLFITGSVITVVFLDIGLIAERWLRHSGRLAPNNSPSQKYLSIVAIIAAIAGGAGLILLSCFDTLRHPKLHDDFLGVFIVGYVLSAILIAAEYGLLRSRNRTENVLGLSFWIKCVFIIVEIALAVAFGILNTTGKHPNVAAILEWTIALIFTILPLSFVIDLLPAAKKGYAHRFHMPGVHQYDTEAQSGDGQMRLKDDPRYNGASNDAGDRTPAPAHF